MSKHTEGNKYLLDETLEQMQKDLINKKEFDVAYGFCELREQVKDLTKINAEMLAALKVVAASTLLFRGIDDIIQRAEGKE